MTYRIIATPTAALILSASVAVVLGTATLSPPAHADPAANVHARYEARIAYIHKREAELRPAFEQLRRQRKTEAQDANSPFTGVGDIFKTARDLLSFIRKGDLFVSFARSRYEVWGSYGTRLIALLKLAGNTDEADLVALTLGYADSCSESGACGLDSRLGEFGVWNELAPLISSSHAGSGNETAANIIACAFDHLNGATDAEYRSCVQDAWDAGRAG